MLCRLKRYKQRRTNTLNQLFHCAHCNQIGVMQRVHEHVWLVCIMLLVCGECQACGTLADSCHLLCQDPLPSFHLAVSHTHTTTTQTHSVAQHLHTRTHACLPEMHFVQLVTLFRPSWYQEYSLKLLLSTHPKSKVNQQQVTELTCFFLTCSWLKLDFFQDSNWLSDVLRV